MAVVTDVRVEALSPTDTTLRWTDNGGSSNDVYRSSNGTDYSEVASNIALGVQEYSDDDLSSETKYWYKVTNDNGSTYSAVVTVWTHSCQDFSKMTRTVSPGFVSGDESRDSLADKINSIAQQIEDVGRKTYFNGTQIIDPEDQCPACMSDGALILDCSGGCHAFYVEADEDINSITTIGCGSCPPVDFVIAADATIEVCGWPDQCNDTGDDCFYNQMAGGATGRTFHAGGQSSPGARANEEADAIVCETESGELHLECLPTDCTEFGGSQQDECFELSCDGEDESVVVLIACGGTPPYTWSFTHNPGQGQDPEFLDMTEFVESNGAICPTEAIGETAEGQVAAIRYTGNSLSSVTVVVTDDASDDADWAVQGCS